MCMSKVTWQAKTKKNYKHPIKWQTGYKVLEINNSSVFRFPYQQRTSQFNFNEILKAHTGFEIQAIYEPNLSTKKIRREYDERYLAGFHVLTNLTANWLFKKNYGDGQFDNGFYKLYEIQYRKVSAIGEHQIHTSYPVDCIIAQEIRVIREVPTALIKMEK